MARYDNVFVVLALILALFVAFSAPARAEFFGCKDDRGKLLYSYSGTPDRYTSRHSRYARVPGWAVHQRASHSRIDYRSSRRRDGRSR